MGSETCKDQIAFFELYEKLYWNIWINGRSAIIKETMCCQISLYNVPCIIARLANVNTNTGIQWNWNVPLPYLRIPFKSTWVTFQITATRLKYCYYCNVCDAYVYTSALTQVLGEALSSRCNRINCFSSDKCTFRNGRRPLPWVSVGPDLHYLCWCLKNSGAAQSELQWDATPGTNPCEVPLRAPW